MIRRILTRRRAAPAAVLLALTLGACGPDLYDVPLPSKVGGDTYPISADFESALNLPVASPVKYEGQVVGEVTKISTVDYRAQVELAISEDTQLPAGTRAEVRLTAPLGEAFVSLVPPEKPTGTYLAAGSTLGPDSTTTAPDVNDLLTGISTTVTGGSYADLKIIVDELVMAMDGSSDTARSLLRGVDTLVTSTNAHTDEIDGALDALDGVSAALAADTDVIADSLERLSPAIATLQRQEDEAVALLGALDRVEAAGRPVLEGLRGRLERQLTDTSTLVDAVIAEKDTIRGLMEGISAFSAALDRATPGDFAMFDLTFNVVPARGSGELDLDPAHYGLSPEGLAEYPDAVIGELRDTIDTVAGEGGLLSNLGTVLGGGR